MQALKFITSGLTLCLVGAAPALAQVDEIIVTATRLSGSSPIAVSGGGDGPGLFLEKKGDFLLLEVTIENDSREFTDRLEGINDTVQKFIEAATNDPDITLSIIDDSFVRPLTKENFSDGIRPGGRPDTSVATLKVKTAIPEKVEDSYKLATKLSAFVDSIPETTRTKIKAFDQISVSVVNPYQYRSDVSKLVVAEINVITDGLGPDYRAIVRGLDKQLKWVRSGDLNLAFYLPYEYDIIPNTLHSYSYDYD